MKHCLTWQKQKLKLTGKTPIAKFQNAKDRYWQVFLSSKSGYLTTFCTTEVYPNNLTMFPGINISPTIP